MTLALEAIIIQMSGSSPKWIPSRVLWVPDETDRESNGCKAVKGFGEVAIEVTEQVSVADMVDLIDTDFCITNVLRQQRVNRNQPGRKYHMLRYVLHPTNEQSVASLEKIKANYADVEYDFVGLLTDSFWRVRAYRNHQAGGGTMISINLEVRVPRVQPDGELIKVCPRDAAGNKIGPALPILPKATLKLSRRDQLLELV